jgi:hypothetical protein
VPSSYGSCAISAYPAAEDKPEPRECGKNFLISFSNAEYGIQEVELLARISFTRLSGRRLDFWKPLMCKMGSHPTSAILLPSIFSLYNLGE